MALAYTILLASFDAPIEAFLLPVLAGQGYQVDRAVGQEDVLHALGQPVDLILLHVFQFEDVAALELLRSHSCAALMVLGPGRNDKFLVTALERGADDYVQRPFRTDELLARIRAQLRRRQRQQISQLYVGTLQIDPAARAVGYAGQRLHLSPDEVALLHTLALQPGYHFPPGVLSLQLWGRAAADPARVGEMICALRAKLAALGSGAPDPICGDQQLGYWLEPSSIAS